VEKATIVRINEFEPLAKNKKQEPKSPTPSNRRPTHHRNTGARRGTPPLTPREKRVTQNLAVPP
jgi:hypothetical protein